MDRWDQSHRVADHHGSRRMGVGIEGMGDPVGCRVLVSEREMDRRSLAGEGIVVVVGSLVGRQARHRVVGEGEECWRSFGREGIVVGLLERSLAEEGIAVGHMVVEGDNRPAVGLRRSSRYLTL